MKMQDNNAAMEIIQAHRIPVSLKRKIDHQQPSVQFERRRIVFNLNKIKYNLCRERIDIIDQTIWSLRKRGQSAKAYLSIRLLQQKRFIEIEEMRKLSSNNFEKSDDDKKACFKWSCEPSSSSNRSITTTTTSTGSIDYIDHPTNNVDPIESIIDHPNSE
jgi:hypothetical protein